MKRLTTIFFALLLTFGALAATSAASKDSKNKSKVEKFVQSLALDYSSHVDYTYISTSMLKGLFAIGLAEAAPLSKALKELKYIRQYTSRDGEGYKQLKKEVRPFLLNEDKVMGMKLVVTNNEDNILTTMYSSKDGLLIITDENSTTLTIVFIAGLSMDAFNTLMEKGMDFDF